MALPISTPKFSPIATPAPTHLRLVPPLVEAPSSDALGGLRKWAIIGLIALTSVVGAFEFGSAVMESGFGTQSDFDAEAVSVEMSTEYYKVRTGDTLWRIASGVSTEKDVRQVVSDLRRLNGDDVVLQPGDILELPVYVGSR